MESTRRYQPAGGLWKKRNHKGEYLSGYVEIDGVRHSITVFPNSFKESTADRKPDFNVSIAVEQTEPEPAEQPF
jgi:hypothetical protein